MRASTFYLGLGTGLCVGTAVWMSMLPMQKPMKTCVGRTMQQMGHTMDEAWERFQDSMSR